jgi:SAM-dependent methyltransferase
MTEPVSDPSYWKQRLDNAHHIHQSVFLCGLDRWKAIEDKHREILAGLISEVDSIFDAGCGYGRLLGLLPRHWRGRYMGVDISPDLIRIARMDHERNYFEVADLNNLSFLASILEIPFTWAVCISMQPMITRNLGGEVWDKMESEILRVANKILFLEYDPNVEPRIVTRSK